MPRVTVLHKLPGKEPTVEQIDRDDIADLQRLVGGYFTAVTIQRKPDVILWCDDEGVMKPALEANLRLPAPFNDTIVGPVVLAGRKGPDLADVPDNALWTDWLNLHATHIEIEVKCMGCGLTMTPTTTDWDLFRQGFQVHDALPCRRALDAKLAAHGGMPSV